ncbi:hypothetical protein PR202_gb08498 [Eleusine coracana subsp. coracana]|uniref:Uncharacterized protein n=1 Tax=Eleusine coracana subsp. coracana TaxID=191504 RepID=A0AAV5EER7_ELECO|nr:hypothetical protein PR202_gb08498 [Eleusine coracana subsp. coracana]
MRGSDGGAGLSGEEEGDMGEKEAAVSSSRARRRQTWRGGVDGVDFARAGAARGGGGQHGGGGMGEGVGDEEGCMGEGVGGIGLDG